MKIDAAQAEAWAKPAVQGKAAETVSAMKPRQTGLLEHPTLFPPLLPTRAAYAVIASCT
ncbi:hypothetical protein [Paraburkholderia nodosa]|uniref:hypothetical protein n=1 Tax=Paraburkholderia nodosa TaxID=392320 RepID=UPI00159F2C49|nr:hypothetical protein [Paraburkholderia nodosa]